MARPMKITQKSTCNKCTALDEQENCTLEFNNHMRTRFGYLIRPQEPCPKPTTQKDLNFCMQTEDYNNFNR